VSERIWGIVKITVMVCAVIAFGSYVGYTEGKQAADRWWQAHQVKCEQPVFLNLDKPDDDSGSVSFGSQEFVFTVCEDVSPLARTNRPHTVEWTCKEIKLEGGGACLGTDGYGHPCEKGQP